MDADASLLTPSKYGRQHVGGSVWAYPPERLVLAVRASRRLKSLAELPRSIEESLQYALPWRSEELLEGRREVFILHGKQIYRLLCTRNDKLILQK